MIAGVHRRRRYRPGKANSPPGLEPAGPPVPPAIAALRRAACPPPPGAATAEAGDDADPYFAGQDPGPDDPGPPAAGSGPALRDAAAGRRHHRGPASPGRRRPRRPAGRSHPA